jgi:hypothetical protein
MLGARPFIPPREPGGVPQARGVYSGGLAKDEAGPVLVKMWFPPRGALLRFLVGWP